MTYVADINADCFLQAAGDPGVLAAACHERESCLVLVEAETADAARAYCARFGEVGDVQPHVA